MELLHIFYIFMIYKLEGYIGYFVNIFRVYIELILYY